MMAGGHCHGDENLKQGDAGWEGRLCCTSGSSPIKDLRSLHPPYLSHDAVSLVLLAPFLNSSTLLDHSSLVALTRFPPHSPPSKPSLKLHLL